MILAHHEIETIFEISPNYVNVLVVEAEDKFYEYCKELHNEMNGDEGSFCLSDGEVSLPLSKCAVLISDIFALSCNDKKTTTKFLQSLQEIVVERYVSEYSEIITKVCELLDRLNAESEYPIEYNVDDALQGIFKAFGIKILDEGGLLERIVAYVKIVSTFLKIKCIFFINLKTIMPKNQLQQLYHEAELNEVNLFLLENIVREKLSGEAVTIIDRDLCEIKC